MKKKFIKKIAISSIVMAVSYVGLAVAGTILSVLA